MRGVLLACFFMLVSVVQAAELRISNLEDVAIGEVAPSVDRITRRVRACVSMSPAGPFQLTATGSGSGGAFQLTNSSGDGFGVLFEVSARQRNFGRRQVLTAGVPAGPFFAREPTADDQCRPPMLVVRVDVLAQALENVPPGRYSGQLQLMVSPE